MDTIPLPAKPDVDQYRKRAKELVRAAHDADPQALRVWGDQWLSALDRLLDAPPTPFVRASLERALARVIASARSGDDFAAFSLGHAQTLIAHAHGFTNWATLVDHVVRRTGVRAADDLFEIAADAVVAGDVEGLQGMLRRRPALARERSARVHHATLLHYVAANGVEDFRQSSPINAVDVARLLLEADAEVDALADTYNGGWWQTTMNLLVSSVHPAAAGVQVPLVAVLAEGGAQVNGLRDDESPLMTALDFGYLPAAQELVRQGARVDSVVAAAALGRDDLVNRFVIDADTLTPGVPLIGPPWRKLPNRARDHLRLALVWACRFGQQDTALMLLGTGVDATACDGYRMTALHYAAASGLTAVTQELLRRGASLEAKNQWGGTVLGSVLHMAVHQPAPRVDYERVVEQLLMAGANPDAVSETGRAELDTILRRHGNR